MLLSSWEKNLGWTQRDITHWFEFVCRLPALKPWDWFYRHHQDGLWNQKYIFWERGWIWRREGWVSLRNQRHCIPPPAEHHLAENSTENKFGNFKSNTNKTSSLLSAVLCAVNDLAISFRNFPPYHIYKGYVVLWAWLTCFLSNVAVPCSCGDPASLWTLSWTGP